MTMLGHLVLLALLLAPIAACASSGSLDAVDALVSWIYEHGGHADGCRVQVNEQGVRGLFATTSASSGDVLARIPASVILNAGSMAGTFAAPTLAVLREMKTPGSRFEKYMATWPRPGELFTACNLPAQYIPLLRSKHWEQMVRVWQAHLKGVLDGALDGHMEMTLPEVVGNASVTLDELKYACAISSTRYVISEARNRMLMIPLFDMANHERDCPHSHSEYAGTERYLDILAGDTVKAGEELCYRYGDMRDDYAVVHYGFLPPLEDPPRMAMVDHFRFTTEGNMYGTIVDEDDDTRFNGTKSECAAEALRMLGILKELLLPATHVPGGQPARDPASGDIYDTLQALLQRRIHALRFEVKRLAADAGLSLAELDPENLSGHRDEGAALASPSATAAVAASDREL